MEDIDIQFASGAGMMITGIAAILISIILFLFTQRSVIIGGISEWLIWAFSGVIQTALSWPGGTMMTFLIGGAVFFIIGLFVIPHPE